MSQFKTPVTRYNNNSSSEALTIDGKWLLGIRFLVAIVITKGLLRAAKGEDLAFAKGMGVGPRIENV